jgi:ABC-type thiamin/hydroxymethylpyrimidine transport system permease subunit
MISLFLPPDVTEAIIGDLQEEARLRRAGRLWIYWQLMRSTWPLLVRAVEREGAINVGLWFVAGYLAFLVPLVGAASIRDFVLTQVPLRAGAGAGAIWIAVVIVANLAGVIFGTCLALKRMKP